MLQTSRLSEPTIGAAAGKIGNNPLKLKEKLTATGFPCDREEHSDAQCTHGPSLANRAVAGAALSREASAPGGSDANQPKIANQVVARPRSDSWGSDCDSDDDLVDASPLENLPDKSGDDECSDGGGQPPRAPLIEFHLSRDAGGGGASRPSLGVGAGPEFRACFRFESFRSAQSRVQAGFGTRLPLVIDVLHSRQ